jgi:hypothetical protein
MLGYYMKVWRAGDLYTLSDADLWQFINLALDRLETVVNERTRKEYMRAIRDVMNASEERTEAQ